MSGCRDAGLIQVPISIIPEVSTAYAYGVYICDPHSHLFMYRRLPGRKYLLSRHPFPRIDPPSHRRPHKRTIMAEALPPLSREDRDSYGRMGTTMEWFHDNFRNTWKVLYGACSSGKRPANMSIRQFLNTGSEFAHHLTMHHTIGISLLSANTISSIS